MKVVPFEALDPADYREIVRRTLAEDLGWGDVTTEATIEPAQRARGIIRCRSDCVIAGLGIAAEAFRQLDPAAAVSVHWPDGTYCAAGTGVAEVAGAAAALLSAERTALNFVQRLSGIATLTCRFVEASGGRITVLDTRNTTPLLRALEKYAVRAGGGVNHRCGLDDGILITDNHVRLAGGIASAVTRMRKANRELPTEVEARSLDQVNEALEAGADVVMFDDLPPAEIVEAVRRCRGRAKTGISGGVTLERLVELSSTGADYVSIGALTDSAPAADITFELEPA